ncbi:unnamed protein product [Rotaria magnacalcarata]|nr:unnamed protein product [Rotaria magnacalcarata]CAF4554669.1 unnamed protein product [Rotaria magnacalcarata]
MKEIKDQLEMIPDYLTKKNKSFKEMIDQILSSITTTTTEEKSNNNTNELRKIVILIYKIMKKLMAEICQSKYEQETSEQEYGFLKKQISYYNLPSQSLTCSNIFNGPLFNSIQNIPLREELIQNDQFYKMTKTNDFNLCKQYAMNYIENNKKQLNYCRFEFTKQEQQFQTCPFKELSFE